MTASTKAPTAMPNRTVLVVGGLLAAAVMVAVIIALMFGGGTDTADGTAVPDSRIPQEASVHASSAQVAGSPLPRFEAGSVDTAIGMTAPAFTASYYDDVETTISPGDGHPRIIMFLAHW